MGEVLNNGVYLPDRGERNAYDGLKGNWNTLDSIAGKVPGYDGHISDTDIHVTAADKQTWNGKADASHVHNASDVTTGVFDAARIPNLDASKITTGTIDIDRLPQGALERLVKVANQAARYALTAADVQLGDTVQQLDTGVMYVVTDETKLDSADGYTEYTAGSATSVPWSGVTGKPADYTPASHSHGNITNDGKLTNGNRVVITGNDKAITEAAVSDTELSYLSGVTSAIQTQLDSKVSDANVVHKTGDETIEGTKTFNADTTFFNKNILINSAQGLQANKSVTIGAKEYGAFTISIYSNKTDVSTGRLVMVTGGQDGHATLGGSYLRFHLNTLANRTYRENGIYFFKRFNDNDDHAEFYPERSDSIDLGKSGYQWKSVYAQSYYYNGTPWGLDQANVWSQSQTISANTNKAYIVANTSYTLGEATPSTTKELGGVFFKDSNSNNAAFLNVVHENTTGDVYTRILTRFKFDNGVKSTTGSAVNTALDIGLTNSAEKFVRPSVNNEVNLGTSTNKWKSFNGINPGALSLPDDSSSISIDTTNWNVSGAFGNSYTPASNGWLHINIKDTATNSIFVYASNKYAASIYGNGSQGLDGRLALMMPVLSGVSYGIIIKAGSISEIYTAKFFPCQGNV